MEFEFMTANTVLPSGNTLRCKLFSFSKFNTNCLYLLARAKYNC